MKTSDDAIKAAVEYLKQLPSELLGIPEDIRLESIQLFGSEWVVTLSYMASAGYTGSPASDNPLARALRTVRREKEFEVNAETGQVQSMTKPKERA